MRASAPVALADSTDPEGDPGVWSALTRASIFWYPRPAGAAVHSECATYMADSTGSYAACKERGNRFFKARQYDCACTEYSAALARASDDAQRVVALNNRALTWLELGEHESAIADCTVALAVEPANVCMPSICGRVVAVRR